MLDEADALTEENSKCRNSMIGSPSKTSKRQRESMSTLFMSPKNEIESNRESMCMEIEESK